MRGFLAIALMAVLSACATAQPQQQSKLQSAVYIAGDASAMKPADPAAQQTKPTTANASTLKRLYWYLGGR